MAKRKDALSDMLNQSNREEKPGWMDQVISPPTDAGETTPVTKPAPKLTKEAREALRAQKRRDRRLTFDLPPQIKKKCLDWSIEYGVPQSQMAVVAFWLLNNAIAQGDVDINALQTKSDSPKFAYNLDLADLIADFD